MGEPLKIRTTIVLATLLLPACSGRSKTPPPVPTAASAPALRATTVMVFPVQDGSVPSADAQLRHWSIDRATLDAEIAYWLPQLAPKAKWVLPELIDRVLARSPSLVIDPRSLAVGSFQRAQVRRIGDPLFGDLRRLAAVLDAQIAVIPIAAEYLGAEPAVAAPTVATAVINALDGTVIWFGVIEGAEKGVGSEGAIAAAAQAFARAFAGRAPAGGQ
jgi:hypothetical protein